MSHFYPDNETQIDLSSTSETQRSGAFLHGPQMPEKSRFPRTVPPASGRTGEAGPGSVNVDGFSERDDSHSEWLPLSVTLVPKWAYAKGDRSPTVRSSHAKPLRGDASEDRRLGPTVPPGPHG